MTGDRYRMVTVQNGKEHVSSVALSTDEVSDHLSCEADLMRSYGWKVRDLYVDGVLHLMCTSPRGRVRRVYAKRFRALEDAVRVDESPPPPRTAHTGEDT